MERKKKQESEEAKRREEEVLKPLADERQRKLCLGITEMGFPLERVVRVCQVCDDGILNNINLGGGINLLLQMLIKDCHSKLRTRH